MLGEVKIEEVDSFLYLESVSEASCKSTKEIRKRLAISKFTVQSILNICKCRGVSTKLTPHMAVSPGHLQKQTGKRLTL